MREACRKTPTVEDGGRARAERTKNMPYMLMTLEVLRLSGSLNSDVYCHVKCRRAHERE